MGDSINAVRFFDEKEADELIVLDIDATVQPNLGLIAKLAEESRMPLWYVGGSAIQSSLVALLILVLKR